MLIGRDMEVQRIHELLRTAADDGQSGVLVVTGEPGIGKSALLACAAERAGDFRVLAVTGVRTESEVPYAGLHALLRPLLERLDQLPPPQAGALKGVLALSDGEPDRFAASAGVFSLLVDAAEDEPVLVLVDDAQWLDA